MSVTTTDNARLITVRHALGDYELHHSQPSDAEARPAPPPDSHPLSNNSSTTNPPGWENQWRRVPAHRTTNNQLDDQRDVYQNEIEHNFVRVMFGGVNMMSSASHLWRATGGKLNETYFKFKIGGEW
ncbi:hypothetical protein LTR56_018844 [Elasticomyces elasticus]|uniref:Uncharacterized protein n=1 Tax=Elasticomyces elasticus TaxID=574655 RepID=A0AAN7VX24_9PEZI|nr:hypothetical protein LTR22_026114 [Elasticomyces elasticus]KAK3628107.1 hypothetical protein LTR56_018844 [Elasticomyces elasticus]KAK4903952.1 hypothetical protein LTR49_026510 [Elasticomyces elasticus]KAK5690365.1 hypothetical protein LTR97_012233 [Elasticomyces elasticus]KAK5738388.1 hypothetical protein LTS12_025616 [Elasticomyces elasticus]